MIISLAILESERADALRILFVSRWFPYPPDNGARIRVFNLLKGLAERHQVDLISFFEEPIQAEHMASLNQYCRNIRALPYQPFRPNSLKSTLGFFALKPRSVMDTFQPDFAAAVSAAVSQNGYDLLIVSQIDMAIYGVSIPNIPKILEELEITKISHAYEQETRLVQKLRLGLTWWKLSAYVRDLLKQYDGCSVVSQIEQAAVNTTHASKIPVIIPNGVDVEHFRPAAEPEVEADALLYHGAISYSVNFEAVAYFIREIFPLILAERPGARFYITGKSDISLIARLPRHERVFFTGYLKDIRPALLRCSVNVIPILTGGGTRLKILEGLAAGLPVVSTTAGAEGLNLENGREVLIADTPRTFAQAVLRVLQDAPLRESLKINGRKFVEAHYDWRAIMTQFEKFMDQTIKTRNSGA